MKPRKSELIALAIIILSIAVGIYFYPQLPDRVASHWDAQGRVNGYMSKFWGVFIMPLVSAVLFTMFLIIPKIDPKKNNIEKFRKYFDNFIILIFCFLFYLYILTIIHNLGYRFNMIIFLTPAFAILFYYIGVLVSKTEPNWTIGIRTPWTLSSDVVWKKTHAISGKLFKASGIISLMGIIFPQQAIWFVLAPVIATAVFGLAYSYFEFRKQTTENRRQ